VNVRQDESELCWPRQQGPNQIDPVGGALNEVLVSLKTPSSKN